MKNNYDFPSDAFMGCKSSISLTARKIVPGQDELKVDYLIICIICDTDSVNKLTLQVYTIHKYE